MHLKNNHTNDNYLDDYGWSSEEGPYSCNYITPHILAILKIIGAKRILDIGSGNGKLCSEIHNEGYEVIGMEYDKRGVEIAQTNYPEIPFYSFGVQDSPSNLLKYEAMFDAVVSTEVIEHLFSPHLLPLYAKNVLIKGGFLIITTPYHGYIKNLFLSILNKWDSHHTPLLHGGHIKFWSKKTLSELLQEGGFSIIGFSGVGRIPFFWKSMILTGKTSVCS